jgi:hypothetical protein
MRVRKRYRNHGQVNDRAVIKTRQNLPFGSWIENVRWNQEVSKARITEKENLDAVGVKPEKVEEEL